MAYRGGYGGKGKGSVPYPVRTAGGSPLPKVVPGGVARGANLAPAGRAAGGAAPQQAPAQTAPQQNVTADQAFSLKTRRLIDHRLRCLHRRFVNERLVRVIAHWVSIPVGTAPFLSNLTKMEIRSKDDKTVQPPASPRKSPPGKIVNVRALLIPGIAPPGTDPAKQHPLKRIELIAGNRLEGHKCIASYGGEVKAGSDAELCMALCDMLKEQCGLDLSHVTTWHKFLELQYQDGNPTIFFAPALYETPAGLTVVPQANEETVEAEETYEEEEEDEEAWKKAVEKAKKEFEEQQKKKKEEEKKEEGKEEEDTDGAAALAADATFDESEVPKPMKKVKKTRTVEKVKKTKTLTPLKFTLGNLLEFHVQKSTAPDTVELCCAADALDEFLKREMATRMVTALRARKQESAERMAAAKAKEEKEQERKRKRVEAEESRKKARKEQEDKLRKEWADEDEGKTDEEKRDSMIERQGILKGLKEKYAKEDKEALEAEAKKGDDSPTDNTTGQKMVKKVDAATLDCFQYFDRTTGFNKVLGTLPRLKIENLLLCVEEEFTLEEITDLLDNPGVIAKVQHIPYKPIATALVPEEKKEEEAKDDKMDQD